MTDDTVTGICNDLEYAINAFMESIDGKRLTQDKAVILFKPVQRLLNDLMDKAEGLECDVYALKEDLQEIKDSRKPSHEDTIHVGKTTLEVKTFGTLSMYTKEALTLFLDALAKDEIETNNILNAFDIL